MFCRDVPSLAKRRHVINTGNIMYLPDSHSLDGEFRSQDIATSPHSGVQVDDERWFALSAPYRRELKAKTSLEQAGMQCFIPMRYSVVSRRNGEKRKELVPVVHNLLFARSSRDAIQDIKRNLGYLQWLTMPRDGRNEPIIVRDNDMENFMRVCQTLDNSLVYLSPDEVNLHMGTRVRIIGGMLNGVEGTLLRVKGSRRKRIVVMIRGVLGVAATETDGFIQVL